MILALPLLQYSVETSTLFLFFYAHLTTNGPLVTHWVCLQAGSKNIVWTLNSAL